MATTRAADYDKNKFDGDGNGQRWWQRCDDNDDNDDDGDDSDGAMGDGATGYDNDYNGNRRQRRQRQRRQWRRREGDKVKDDGDGATLKTMATTTTMATRQGKDV